jgi:hypothetical protein
MLSFWRQYPMTSCPKMLKPQHPSLMPVAAGAAARRWWARWALRCAIVCAIGAASGARLAGAQPLAQILSPATGFKLRQGQSAAVAIAVADSLPVSWTLSLQDPTGALTVLASGTGASFDATVAGINAATLSAGETYQLILVATDSVGTGGAQATFSIPDPQYALIPLEEGTLSLLGANSYGVNAAGTQVFFPRTQRNQDPTPIQLLDLTTGSHPLLLLPIANNTGVKFSGDGTRIYFKGDYRGVGFDYIGLEFGDIGSRTLSMIAPNQGSPFFSVDWTGSHVAHEIYLQDNSFHYAVYTEGSGDQQLPATPDPVFGYIECVDEFGATPLITPDGSRMVFITSSTLGMEPTDPSIGCRVYAYDVATQTITQLAALPPSLVSIDSPSLTDDGRWLSFAVIQLLPGGGSYGAPALIDLQSGVLSVPAVDTQWYTSFDSAITRNGAGMIISTQADLDPRVGNADHNLELFYYDRSTAQFTQITETIAGIGKTPNNCGSYQPSVSADGSVALFGFSRISVEGCQLDGPQRNEADGLDYALMRAVRKRPGNQAVVLDTVPDQQVVAGQMLTLALTAHDPDGDPIYFFAQTKDGMDVPTGSTINDNYDGTATFVWPTTTAQVGDYVLRVAAFDEGGGEQFQDVTISILAHSASSCAGDCDGKGAVTVEEIITMVGYALNGTPVGTPLCPGVDQWCSGSSVTVDCIIAAVNNALDGCPIAHTPTPTPTSVAGSCVNSLAPDPVIDIGSCSADGCFAVSAPGNCCWVATGPLSITSGNSGCGDGTVCYLEHQLCEQVKQGCFNEDIGGQQFTFCISIPTMPPDTPTPARMPV